MSFFESAYQDILKTGTIEWLAVITSVAYVILAALRSIWCWTFAILSSGLYVYLCFTALLYLESILQMFYVAMAIVGWYAWIQQAKLTGQVSGEQNNTHREISLWPWKYHLINIALSGILALLLGYLFDQFTAQKSPYMDAFTTIFSLAATFMVVRKVLENWIYWIVIDLVSIFLYHQRGYSLSAVLYFLFAIIAAVGFFAWRTKYKTQTA